MDVSGGMLQQALDHRRLVAMTAAEAIWTFPFPWLVQGHVWVVEEDLLEGDRVGVLNGDDERHEGHEKRVLVFFRVL